MEKTPVQRSVQARGLPEPVGPYSPAVVFDRLVFVSGQGAIDPATGPLAGLDVESQTGQVFDNLEAILKAAGTDLRHVIRCGVFLVDMRDFAAMNAVYARRFGDQVKIYLDVALTQPPAGPAKK